MFRRKKKDLADIPPVTGAPVSIDVPPKDLEKAKLHKISVEIREADTQFQMQFQSTAFVFTISAQWTDWRMAEGGEPCYAPPIDRNADDVNSLRKFLMVRVPGAVVPPLGETTAFGNEYIEPQSRLAELTAATAQFFEAVLMVCCTFTPPGHAPIPTSPRTQPPLQPPSANTTETPHPTSARRARRGS